jgi:hypothetical protein
MRSSDQPLPGDIVIVERLDTTTWRPSVVYVLRHWPQDVSAGGPYQSFTYARQKALKLAAGSGAHVWRVHTRAGTDSYEDVSDQ